MLVLTRKKGESIKIGDDIEITVVAIGNDQIKIGIDAPKNVEILRKELFEEVKDQNKQAIQMSGDILSRFKNLGNDCLAQFICFFLYYKTFDAIKKQ